MGYLKVESSLIILDIHSNIKYKYGNRQGLLDTVGRNEQKTKESIQNQL